ncbi:MAG: NUDIX hydrolase [Armatimonadetes bacterium]|nr:NUDIX hydrolase [Armatimonadota bacterium]
MAGTDPSAPRPVDSRLVYKGRVINLTVDHLETPDGRVLRRETVRHGGGVAIVPLTPEGDVLLVRQYRHAAGGWLTEIPAGTLEPGEEPAACAARELEEETGYTAGGLHLLGRLFLAPGYSTEVLWVYLATDLADGTVNPDDDEVITLCRAPLDTVWCSEQQPVDAKSVAALALAREWLSIRRRDTAQPGE